MQPTRLLAISSAISIDERLGSLDMRLEVHKSSLKKRIIVLRS